MEYRIVTNNDHCLARYADQYAVEYQADWTYLDVLVRCRDLIHGGLRLVTHPMAGSLKPNQTPYRTVVLAEETMQDQEPWEDVVRIESSIDACRKFLACRGLPHWPQQMQNDFKTLDVSFIEGALSQARARG